MSLLQCAGGTLENDMDDLDKDVVAQAHGEARRKRTTPVWSPRWTSTASISPNSGKAVFAQLGTWAQGNMSNTLGADKIVEANTLQYSADNPVNFFYQCNWTASEGSAPLRGEIRSRRRLRQVRVRALDGLV